MLVLARAVVGSSTQNSVVGEMVAAKSSAKSSAAGAGAGAEESAPAPAAAPAPEAAIVKAAVVTNALGGHKGAPMQWGGCRYNVLWRATFAECRVDL